MSQYKREESRWLTPQHGRRTSSRRGPTVPPRCSTRPCTSPSTPPTADSSPRPAICGTGRWTCTTTTEESGPDDLRHAQGHWGDACPLAPSMVWAADHGLRPGTLRRASRWPHRDAVRSPARVRHPHSAGGAAWLLRLRPRRGVPMTEQEQATLTLDQVRDRVKLILQMDLEDGDPEAAHMLEDQLYVDVLRAVIADEPNAREMAVEMLRIREESPGIRWYA